MSYDEQHKPQYDDPSERKMGDSESATEPTTSEIRRLTALARDIQHSYKNLEWLRAFNHNMVKEYVGPNYGPRNPAPSKFINKMQQTVDAYTILLAANRPQVLITTEHKDLRGFANHYQVAVNNLIKEIKLEDTIRRWVLDAFLSVGIVKAHLGDSGQVIFENDVAMDPGSPFASNVLVDDWVSDSNAKKVTDWKYAGDAYQIPFEDIKEGVEHGMYFESAAREIRPNSNDGVSGARVDEMTREHGLGTEAFTPMVDLCDIWIPKERSVYTFHVTHRSEFQINPNPLSIMEFDARESGPYIWLGFSDVPGSPIPSAPTAHLESLDRLANSMMRKAARQGRRQRDIPTYTPAGTKAMERVMSHGDDGKALQVNDTRDVGNIRLGGVDPGTQAFIHDLLGLFDTQAGNLTAMLGLGAQSDTVGQEQLIHNAGSKKGGQMQYRVTEAVNELVSCLGGMLWEDEFKSIPGSIPIDGSRGKSITSNWEPGDREGNLQQYNFEVNRHSMGYQPPVKKVEAINSLLAQVYFPLQALMEKQGGEVDLAKLTELYADMLNLPRLKDIIRFTGREYDQYTPGPSQTVKPPVTTRNYTRKSIPSGTEDGNRSNNSQAWLALAGSMNGSSGPRNGAP